MPLTHFLGLIAMVVAVAGLTLWLAFWSGLPFAAVMFGAVAASVILTWSRAHR
jgi:hypothetical protein